MSFPSCVLVTLLLLTACRSTAPTSLDDVFAAHAAEGAFTLLDLETGERFRSDPARCAQRVRPASTFKVFHFMAALETGAVASVEEVVPWDRVIRGGAWDQDHDLVSALETSAIWVFEETARRIGRVELVDLMRRERYGNARAGGPHTAFWLRGELAISADEQARFLAALWRRELGFPVAAQHAVLAAMELEREGDWTLYGKTGWSLEPEHGWLVGIVRSGARTAAFALLVRPAGDAFDMRAARREILEAALARLGFGLRRTS